METLLNRDIENALLGTFFGLAIGDAVGTTVEFRARDSFNPLNDMIGGGPFNLQAGEWTDDTAMALCLAENLESTGNNLGDIDPADLMNRFVNWWRYGHNSCTGTCFDIGSTTAFALRRFESSGDPYAGSTDEFSAGNGSIMRLAPVVLRYWNDPISAQCAAYTQGIVTHGADECVDACAMLTHVLIELISGRSLRDALKDAPTPKGSKIVQLRDLELFHCARDDVRSSGYVYDTLHAAFWCLNNADNPRDVILLAANLGDDADTVAAVAGQLAGARWGLNAFPTSWLERLAWRDQIMNISRRLIEIGQSKA
jgi:ADP-ribosyl-[dinitrogen reductase] hydrolase